MNPILIVVLVIVVAVIAATAWWYSQKRRSDRLHQRFGPEYERAVDEHGDRGRAEAALEDRKERVEQLHLRPLSPEQRDRFGPEWRHLQARFVDVPEEAVKQADSLVAEVMAARGYPTGDFEQRVADVSVDHPQVVEHYRAAHAIALRMKEGGQANTEDLRQAMVHYRALFENLLETDTPEPISTSRKSSS